MRLFFLSIALMFIQIEAKYAMDSNTQESEIEKKSEKTSNPFKEFTKKYSGMTVSTTPGAESKNPLKVSKLIKNLRSAINQNLLKMETPEQESYIENLEMEFMNIKSALEVDTQKRLQKMFASLKSNIRLRTEITPATKENPSKNHLILRHIATVRELKQRFMDEQNKELKEKWKSIFLNKDLDDLKEYLKNTVTGKFLISEAKAKNKTISDTLKSLINPLVEGKSISEEKIYDISKKLLQNEIINSQKYYLVNTASKGNLVFLYKIITEFSNYFSITPSRELLKLRFSERNDIPYFNSMEDYIDALFKNKGLNLPDHSPFARKTQISTNFSFLSNLDQTGECSLIFAINNVNISDPFEAVLKSVLMFYLKDPKLVEERYKKYLKAYNDSISDKGASLIQIFIKKDKIDSLAYLSGRNGIPYVNNNGTLETADEDAWESIRESETLEGRSKICETIINDILNKFFNYENNETNDAAMVALFDAIDNLKKIDDIQSLDPFESLMSDLTEQLKSILGTNTLSDDINPEKIYKDHQKEALENKKTLFPISEFVYQYLNNEGSQSITPLRAQARVLIRPELLDRNIVKFELVPISDSSPVQQSIESEDLAKLIQEDIAYYLEHTEKADRTQNKLERLKEFVEK